jgi:hypothetical protein
MKESLQTGLLEGLELAIHTVGATDAGGPTTERSADSLLQAVLLDLQALGLKQSLQAVAVSEQQQQQQTAAPSAAGGAGPSTEAQEIIANTFASPAARLAAARAAVAAMSSDSGTSSSSSGSEMPVGNDPSRRMQHVMNSLTPEEVQATQDLTLLELAGAVVVHNSHNNMLQACAGNPAAHSSMHTPAASSPVSAPAVLTSSSAVPAAVPCGRGVLQSA